MDLDIRQAVRAVLLDEDDRLLLVRFVFPSGIEVWALPGGGLQPNEAPIDGLRRELDEELSLTGVAIGPEIWERTHIIPMRNGQDGQHDRMFIVRVNHFDPQPKIGWEALNDELVFEMRWWSIDEIDAAHEAGARFAPRRLGEYARRLIEGEIPDYPVDVGV